MKKTIFAALLVCVSGVLAFGQQAAPGIQNFLKINTEFCTGGQPTPAHLAELAHPLHG